MEKKSKELFELFDDLLKSTLTSDIKNLSYKISASLNDVDDEWYEIHSFQSFLAFWKIDRLAELGIISNPVATSLKDLWYLKLDTDRKIGIEAIREMFEHDSEDYNASYTSPLLPKLRENSEKIDAELRQYYLIPYDTNLKEIIDSVIRSEDYSNVPNEIEISGLVKTLKPINDSLTNPKIEAYKKY